MKSVLLTMLAFTTIASTAVAQKGEKQPQNPKALLQQIAELKAMIAKMKSQSAHERDRALRSLKAAELARRDSEKRRVEIEIFRKRGELHKPLGAYARAIRVHVEKGKGKGEHAKLPAELQSALNRLENLRAAIKHLKASGMKDLAAEAGKRADKIQAEVNALMKKHNAHAHDKHAHKPKGGATPNHLRDLSAAIMQLRKQVHGLQKAVERLERRK